MPRHIESQIQRECVAWFRRSYPWLAKLLFAVPNGGRRGAIEAAIMKGEGVTPGVADLLLMFPSGGHHALCIEMKTAKGRQQPTQKAWQSIVEAYGYRYVICRSLHDFQAEVEAYLRGC